MRIAVPRQDADVPVEYLGEGPERREESDRAGSHVGEDVPLVLLQVDRDDGRDGNAQPGRGVGVGVGVGGGLGVVVGVGGGVGVGRAGRRVGGRVGGGQEQAAEGRGAGGGEGGLKEIIAVHVGEAPHQHCEKRSCACTGSDRL